uniref:2'-phosphotransferase n=1 Tax=Timema bartmani TaxID=61472 RepID=A0A7R9ENW4_9NEOP|nr:unnamed protein product [Timema bartmani]
MSQGRDIALSKLLSWSLRHGAEKEGLDITDDGFINVRDLLNHRLFRGKYTLEDIQRVVAENNKQRFYLRTNQDGGILQIRANQGHSIKKITNLDLTPIIDERDFPVIIHGTHWQHWDQIRTEGLSRMNRLHIHFSPGEPSDSQVISGMRQSCQIYIYIDVRKALAVKYVVITLKKITNLDLTPIIDERDFPVIIHGTHWQHWDQIRTEGLSRMNRLHIHFSPGEPSDSQVISGMRQSCQIYIYIDVRKALADGLKFYKSKNNVILSPGNERGYIRPQYFSQVVQVSPSKY